MSHTPENKLVKNLNVQVVLHLQELEQQAATAAAEAANELQSSRTACEAATASSAALQVMCEAVHICSTAAAVDMNRRVDSIS